MLSCGSRVEMSTEGGTFFYDTDQYNSWYAMPTHSQDYSGAERAFYFIHPGGEDGLTRRVDINLQSPCENMDLYYFKTWNEFECYPGECAPCQQDHDLSQNSGNQDDMLSIYDSNDNSYLIIVESRYGFPSPFVLTIDCD